MIRKDYDKFCDWFNRNYPPDAFETNEERLEFSKGLQFAWFSALEYRDSENQKN